MGAFILNFLKGHVKSELFDNSDKWRSN